MKKQFPFYFVVSLVLLSNQGDEIKKIHAVNEITSNSKSEYIYIDDQGREYKCMLGRPLKDKLGVRGIVADEKTILLEQSCSQEMKAFYCKEEFFAGCSRIKAKTTVFNRNRTAYKNLALLIARLNGYAGMKKKIQENGGREADRVEEEKELAVVKNVYLYAIMRENDNDYHMIISDKSGSNKFNVEVSAISRAGNDSESKLAAVRKKVDKRIGGALSCKGDYVVFENMIPIRKLKGSLFFDNEHEPDEIGPKGLFNMKTSWEIHPLVDIEF